MDNHILLALSEAKKSNKIVSLHSNPSDQSACSVGFVDRITDNMVRLKCVSPDGGPGGYEIRSLQEIFRVDVNGKYEKKINFLKNNYSSVFCDVELVNSTEGANLIFATLEEAKQKKIIVVLWTEDQDDSVIGYVDDLSLETVRILSIDDYGQQDGFVAIDLSEVSDVDCNSPKCQQIKYLNTNWNL